MSPYAQLQPLRYFVQRLDAERIAELYGDRPFRFESEQHPCVVYNPEPTAGAKRYLVQHQAHLQRILRRARSDAQSAVCARLQVEGASLLALKRKRSTDEIPSDDVLLAELREELISEIVNSDEECAKYAMDVFPVQLAVTILRFEGDWRVYEFARDDIPEWPNLREEGAFRRRMATLDELADHDIHKLYELTTKTVVVEEKELGNSNAPQSSPD